MNEQIRELIRQADSLARAIEPDLKEVARYNRIRDEKFAELIVKECVAMADDFECDVNQSGLVDRMKQHFGVEE